MKRGEIYFADLNPTVGNEIKKNRPVLIVSNNANNKMSDTITVVPVTSNTKKIYPFEVLLEKNATGLSRTSKAQCHQVRTISKQRIHDQTVKGNANSTLMAQVNAALRLHLNL